MLLVIYSITIKSKAMNTQMKDPGNGGCCGGIGCC
jgi:hypothetical protein